MLTNEGGIMQPLSKVDAESRADPLSMYKMKKQFENGQNHHLKKNFDVFHGKYSSQFSPHQPSASPHSHSHP